MLLALPQPYDFELSTERFRAFGDDLANLWRDGALHRVVGGRDVRIRAAPGGVEVEPLDDETRPIVERLLGLPFDLDGFYAWDGDRVVAGLAVRLRGFRPPLSPDPFEALVSSITAQQVSLRSACAIRSRFVRAYGVPGGHAFGFPTRDAVARASVDELFALGFTRRKAEYVVDLARAELDLDALAALPDEEVRAVLVAQRGLGEWTADWFLARHLARPNAWPAGDLALRKAVAAFYADFAYAGDVHAVGRRLHPFQNLAAHYLLTGARTP